MKHFASDSVCDAITIGKFSAPKLSFFIKKPSFFIKKQPKILHFNPFFAHFRPYFGIFCLKIMSKNRLFGYLSGVFNPKSVPTVPNCFMCPVVQYDANRVV